VQGQTYHSSLRDETGLGCLAKVRPEMAGDGAHSAHMALHMHPSGNTLAAAGEICPKRYQQPLDMSRQSIIDQLHLVCQQHIVCIGA